MRSSSVALAALAVRAIAGCGGGTGATDGATSQVDLGASPELDLDVVWDLEPGPDIATYPDLSPPPDIVCPQADLLGYGSLGPAMPPTHFKRGESIVDFDQPPQAVDLNGDDHLDLVTTRNGAIAVFLGHGDGTFAAPLLSAELAPTDEGAPFSVADFDGDHRLDLAGKWAVALGKGDGTFESGWTLPPEVRGALFGDLDGDGIADALASIPTGYHHFDCISFLGNGRGGFKRTVWSTVGDPISCLPAFLGEYSGDGNLDFVSLGDDGGGLGRAGEVFLGAGHGGFTSVASSLWLTGPGYEFAIPCTADFTGDGVSDILAWGGNPNGTFDVRVLAFANNPGFDESYPKIRAPIVGACADFDGDGLADILDESGIGIWWNVKQGFSNYDPETLSPRALAVAADFNEDRRADLLRCDSWSDCNQTPHYYCTVYLEAK